MTSTTPAPHFGLLEPMALAGLSGLEFLNGMLDGSVPAPPFAEVTDVAPIAIEPGRITFTGRPSRRFYNPMSIVHGGWISLILDTVMGCAVHSGLPAGFAFTTIEMKTVYVRALREEDGPVTCEGILLQKGAQIAHAEGKLYDSQRRLVAYGSETCLLRNLAGKTK